jgi:hypothetical protein
MPPDILEPGFRALEFSLPPNDLASAGRRGCGRRLRIAQRAPGHDRLGRRRPDGRRRRRVTRVSDRRRHLLRPAAGRNGIVFADSDGTPRDILQILKSHGFNFARLRTFSPQARAGRLCLGAHRVAGDAVRRPGPLERRRPSQPVHRRLAADRALRSNGVGLRVTLNDPQRPSLASPLAGRSKRERPFEMHRTAEWVAERPEAHLALHAIHHPTVHRRRRHHAVSAT